ncbi:thioredoxin family protein [Flavobacterium sp. Sd200]|uniref:thioredoxin family protein n=1 Tax=Flavobacterium sp. Sd200 TaxID=2692211 RepID=UPI00136DA24E|nr:thioredoxin family protein [Flavobacterium sp. Sd200]MXN92093.1 thioredoxin family protein [Flavobacterium sp. Sd200]
METTQTIIESGLKDSFTYAEYRNHVSQLLLQGLSTGNTQSEDLTHYTTLNEVRMNRLDKTIKIPAEIQQKLESLDKDHVLLVLSEGWCGDAAQILPVINKMAQVTDKLDLQIVLRDDHAELMDLYLTNGARSIPKLVLLDKETLQPQASWGPRPEGGANLIKEFKEKHGAITAEAKTELQKWYLQDKGLSTMQEIIDKIK